MYLVQLLLPLRDNAGRTLPRALFVEVRDELTERFGGITAYLRAPAEGMWRDADGRPDRDDVVMCEVMVQALDRAWWASYRAFLERRFGQLEIVARALPLERL
jgi:hypothetical protein